MFLVNVVLARTQPKEEYGVFALSYSVFTFLTALHNASILEAFTIYGSGRYRDHLPAYSRLLWRSNILLSVGLSLVLAIVWRVLAWAVPSLGSYTILGMALTCGSFLSATFVRRTFYIRRRPDLAAKLSFVFFLICAFLLWLSVRFGILNGFYAFLIVGTAWLIACVFAATELPGKTSRESFTDLEPNYWSEHWKYSRWVLATAFVVQTTTQGYYWLLAGFLSVTEVANLRAMTMIVTPMDQVFIALNYLVLPLMASLYATHGAGELQVAWRRYALAFAGLTTCFAFSVRFLGPVAMHFLYAGKFDSLTPLLSTLAFLPIVMGVGYTITAALQSAEKPKLVFWGYLAGGAATFVFGTPLVIHFGLRGAVYGMLITGGAYTSTLGWGLVTNVFKQTRVKVLVGS
jgi:O-antigen/teichoic acid export membrane protein